MTLHEQIASADLIAREYLQPHFAGQGMERVALDELTPRQLDVLPFGAIQLDRAGMILKYNDYESRLARVNKGDAIGKNFFTDVAPCTKVKEFYGRFQEGVANKELFQKFRYRFAFKSGPRDVTVTLFYSDITHTIWVFIRPV
jgi:photoactive yellow protein